MDSDGCSHSKYDGVNYSAKVVKKSHMRKGYAIFCLVVSSLRRLCLAIARGCVASRSIAPLAGNRYKVATTHAQRALLLREREDDGEGLEGSHELLLQFGDLSFGEG